MVAIVLFLILLVFGYFLEMISIDILVILGEFREFFWNVFVVFFLVVIGIMVGVSMFGDL